MADREQPYDPYIPSGAGNGAQQGGNSRTAALQAVSGADPLVAGHKRNMRGPSAQRRMRRAGST